MTPDDTADTCHGYVCDICGKRLEGEPLHRFETFCTCKRENSDE